MKEIELWTAGGFVAVVDIPLFQDSAMPDVVMWGSRVFRRDTGGLGMRWKYVECFAFLSLTPSPGRPLEAIEPPSNPMCRGCGKALSAENRWMSDGCPCNSPRGINHGLVSKEMCTCALCDPEQKDRLRVRTVSPVAPVDRSARCTVGEAVAPGVANIEDRGDGQQKGYVVLCDEERAKGFVRPVRRTYLHEKCGMTTMMGVALAETYARDPEFYSGTFCCTCGAHFPVGADGEFTWVGTREKVGT